MHARNDLTAYDVNWGVHAQHRYNYSFLKTLQKENEEKKREEALKQVTPIVDQPAIQNHEQGHEQNGPTL